MMKTSSPLIRFVATPFLPEYQPALGISSLKAQLVRAGHNVDIRYLNIDYGNRIGWEINSIITQFIPTQSLVGEIIFARSLWDDLTPDLSEYFVRFRNEKFFDRKLDQKTSALNLDEFIGIISMLHCESASIIKKWAQELLVGNPRIIGFSTSFQQNIPSLSLAKELRRLRSREELCIIFGGANCEGEMAQALVDNFPYIDHVVSGEGEPVILELIDAILNQKKYPAFPFARTIRSGRVEDMDSLPIPDFKDFFIESEGKNFPAKLNLSAESSRGCWWGAKSHCKFCGLNGSNISYRSKNPERFLNELEELSASYGISEFMITDNIMDMKYIQSIFPKLAGGINNLKMFYEVLSNLKKEQIKIIAAAGVVRIQPGIESLSTSILKLMGKGTSRLKNLQTLKWCEEYGVQVTWNLLHGFPGEQEDEYASMAELIPNLVHLPAPTGDGRVRLDRFGPYWCSPQKHGITNVRHHWAYDHAYAPLPPEQRARLAYFFEYDYADHRIPENYTRTAIDRLADWRLSYFSKLPKTLELTLCNGRGEVTDTRYGIHKQFDLSEPELFLLKVLDKACSRNAAFAEFSAVHTSATVQDFTHLLDKFMARKWVVVEDEKFLSLVLDRSLSEEVVDYKVNKRLEQLGLSFLSATPKSNEINEEDTIELYSLSPSFK
ncbi:MAG: RiPP maturation radical SAM C-methyltransferase [Sideroxydans sp.]|nr:RiPP maturation radical SAM C-methyltransferase [Sideroxydans sp.]